MNVKPQTLEQGVGAMYRDYCHGNAGHELLVVTGNELDSAGDAALLEQVLAVLASLARSVRCLQQRDIGADGQELWDAFRAADIVLLFGKTRSIYRQKVLDFLRTGPVRPAIYRCFDFSGQLFRRAFTMPAHELDSLHQAIILAGTRTQTVAVHSDSGTDLRIQLDPCHQWTNSCGKFNGRFPGVFPAGEVNTYPGRVDGRLVCDGAINCSIGFPRSVLFARSPLVLDIADSVIVGHACEDPIVRLFMERWRVMENSFRVGEAGFGTNIGSSDFVDFCSHLNERHPGLHIGFGTPTQSARNVAWTCPVHLDLIPRETRIDFDNVPVFRDGRYLRGNLDSLAAAGQHGLEVVDVDAV